MDREQMIKHKWKAYEKIWVKYPRWEWAYEFMATGIDFDDECIDITPFEPIYEGHGKPSGRSVGIQFCYFKNPTPDKIPNLTVIQDEFQPPST